MLGFGLILTGLIVIFVTMVLLLHSSANSENKARGGGVIIIGLFPIVFGTDRRSVKALLALSIILMVVVLLVNLFLNNLRW